MIKVRHHIGGQTVTAESLPKIGDREDFTVRVVGPDPSTDFRVPLSITGTALSIWGNPNPQDAAEQLAVTIFDVAGTAKQPDPEGFWFDSYNSGTSIRDTQNKIRNESVRPFFKNEATAEFYVKLLGFGIRKKLEEIDMFFLAKFGRVFFKSLDDAFEVSRMTDDLNSPPGDNAHFLYRIGILAGIIDHFAVEPSGGALKHNCSVCGRSCTRGPLQSFKDWLVGELGQEKAGELTKPFQMIKNLRKQYPIHDHFETISGERRLRKEVLSANEFFGITDPKAYETNWNLVVVKFGETISAIMQSF